MKNKILVAAAFVLLAMTTYAQAVAKQPFRFTGKQFFAITVSNADSASRWYEQLFDLKLMKEIKLDKEGVHVRIVGNEQLTLEFVQTRTSFDPSRGNEDEMVRGLAKVGFYVDDVSAAERFFRSRNIKIKYGPFDDKDTHSRSFVMEDLNGVMIQVLQDTK